METDTAITDSVLTLVMAPAVRGAGGKAPRCTTAVFLFTDLVDSTAWKGLLGDREYAVEVRQPHDRLFRELLRAFPGAAVRDNAGDGFLATFANPSDAVVLALRFHRVLGLYAWGPGVRRTCRQPATRVGIHLGEAVEYGDVTGRKVAGQAVDLAARVMGMAVGGQTLLTRHAFDSARQHVRDSTLVWLPHGRYRLNGYEHDPLEVFEVGAAGHAPLASPPDGPKGVRIDPPEDPGRKKPAPLLPYFFGSGVHRVSR